jgi:hypothetical protein
MMVDHNKIKKEIQSLYNVGDSFEMNRFYLSFFGKKLKKNKLEDLNYFLKKLEALVLNQ